MRLTDQALVASTVADQVAQRHARPASAADVLVGLASETDGWAGRLLRGHASASARLVERAGSAPGGLPSAPQVLARAEPRAAPRPAATADVLAAVLEVGGSDVTDLLSASGLDPAALYRATDGAGSGGETRGLGAQRDRDLDTIAGLAVARVRAEDGGAVELLLQLAATAGDDELLPCDADELVRVRERLQTRGRPAPADPPWDRGLQAVLTAARHWREGAPVSPRDLVRAAVIAGGEGPATLLDAAVEQRQR